MSVIIVQLQCITNLHVGSSDVNYNIIDREVERDPITGYPIINASSVKGCLRYYFQGLDGIDDSLIDSLFGRRTANKTISPGQLKVLSAELLAMPGRASAGDQAYYLMTTQSMIERYQNIYRTFLRADCDRVRPGTASLEGVRIEGETPVSTVRVGERDLYMLSDESFRHLSLPIIARHPNEGGAGSGSWYEEYVPYESLFYFAALSDDESLMELFKERIDGALLQLGADITIGHGFCHATLL